jgi:hypothetical protein
MTNVDSILNYTRTEDEDYYAILGCDESATVTVKVKYLVTTTYFLILDISFELICNHVLYKSWDEMGTVTSIT